MMRYGVIGFGFFVCLACGAGGEETQVDKVEITLEERAAKVADVIENSPGSIDEALTQQGFTAASFESTMFEIAADPGRTRAFLSARKP